MGIFIFSLLILKSLSQSVEITCIQHSKYLNFFKVRCKFKKLPLLCSLYSFSNVISFNSSFIYLLMSVKFKTVFSIFSLNFKFLFLKFISQSLLVPQIQCWGTSCNSRSKWMWPNMNITCLPWGRWCFPVYISAMLKIPMKQIWFINFQLFILMSPKLCGTKLYGQKIIQS